MIFRKLKQDMHVVIESADRDSRTVTLRQYPRLIGVQTRPQIVLLPRLAILGAEHQMNQIFGQRLGHPSSSVFSLQVALTALPGTINILTGGKDVCCALSG